LNTLTRSCFFSWYYSLFSCFKSWIKKFNNS